jgi:hypothetical protein
MSAQITFMQEQLNAALSQVTILEQKVASQQEFIVTQVAWNKSMSAESEQLDMKLTDETEQLNSRLVSTDAKAEAAHTAAKTADSIARKAADTANKSIQAAISHQSRLKTLEDNMTKLLQAQPQTSQQAAGPLAPVMADTSENSLFFGGVPAFRDRLDLHPHSDPIFVVSRLLRDMGLYAGMDSIVLADNAAKSRLEARAVIIHMRSSFHKRAAMVILRRELASQRLPGTTVRDCFPTVVMDKVKRLTKIGMELKKAGKITKFQVINRKGQPVLQTGVRNQNYVDFQGDAQDEVSDSNGEWTLVQSRRKRPHPDGTLTSPNSRPLEADRPKNSQPPPTAATWAALTEQEFPELSSQAIPAPAKKQPATNKTPAQPQAGQLQAAQSQAAKPKTAQGGAQQETGDQPSKKQPSGRPAEATGGPHQPS